MFDDKFRTNTPGIDGRDKMAHLFSGQIADDICEFIRELNCGFSLIHPDTPALDSVPGDVLGVIAGDLLGIMDSTDDDAEPVWIAYPIVRQGNRALMCPSIMIAESSMSADVIYPDELGRTYG